VDLAKEEVTEINEVPEIRKDSYPFVMYVPTIPNLGSLSILISPFEVEGRHNAKRSCFFPFFLLFPPVFRSRFNGSASGIGWNTRNKRREKRVSNWLQLFA
jgi:hypothetical protein